MNKSQQPVETVVNPPGSPLPWFAREPVWMRVLTLGLMVFGLMYIRFVFLVGMNHDEVEHAQVAFRILSGELPYRDFYQNHWPVHWLMTTRFVEHFPFSLHAILAGRAVSLLALFGCWWLGLRLLQQIPGGYTRLSIVMYSFALITFAFSSDFYMTRPDNLMTLFTTAGLCLVPASGPVRGLRAFLLGLLFGLAFSVSSKMAPVALVVPLLILIQASRERSPVMLLALLAYGTGAILAMLPTVLWLASNDLLGAFYFDAIGLNLALSKHWYQSFELLKVAVFLPAWLGILAWFIVRWQASYNKDNGFLVVLLAMGCGLILAYISRHPSIYNLQVLTVPLAVAFASLAGYLGMHLRDPASRVVMITALLAYPVSYTATQISLFKGDMGTSLDQMQALFDLARPGGRNCIAFSPIHPVWCHSISQLSNDWDLYFAINVTDPEQQKRFQRIWQEGMARTLELQPDIILRDSAAHIWEQALENGLIRQQDLDALDLLSTQYDVKLIGENELWVKKTGDANPGFGRTGALP